MTGGHQSVPTFFKIAIYNICWKYHSIFYVYSNHQIVVSRRKSMMKLTFNDKLTLNLNFIFEFLQILVSIEKNKQLKDEIIFFKTYTIFLFLVWQFDILGKYFKFPKYPAWTWKHSFTKSILCFRRGQINLIWLKDDYSGMSDIEITSVLTS